MTSIETIRNFINSQSRPQTVVKDPNKLVLSIYGICKNELHNLDRWVNQFKEVDHFCILDTGSTDGTYEKLQEYASKDKRFIIDQKIYKEFHFDDARNDSFKLVPKDTDICLLLDFDEQLDEDWYDKLISNYKNILRDKVLYIKRVVYNEEGPTGDTNYRIFTHSYDFMNFYKWAGYAAENLVHTFRTSNIDEIDNDFKTVPSFETDLIKCKHFVLTNLNIVLKDFSGKILFVRFFEDTHKKIMESNNFLDIITYMDCRFLDYNSFRHIFMNYAGISNVILDEEYDRFINVINNQKIDLLNFYNSDLKSYILDTIVKNRLIYFGGRDILSDMAYALANNSSDREHTLFIFKEMIRIQKEAMKGKVKYENN